MGYIIKKGTGGGGGGGDATAANQQLQITQLEEGSGNDSVFKDINDNSVFVNVNDESIADIETAIKLETGNISSSVYENTSGPLPSVFKNAANESVLKSTINNDSVFKDNGRSVFVADNTYSVFKEQDSFSTFNTDQNRSLFYKSLVNDQSGSTARSNFITSIGFTDASLAAVSGLLNGFLAVTPCVVISCTYSHQGLNHDILLLYSVL